MNRTKKIYKKIIIEFAVLATVFALFAPLGTTVLAASEEQQVTSVPLQDLAEAQPTSEQFAALGLSEEEVNMLLESHSSGITLRDGIAYDANGNILEDQVGTASFGKFSWATKAILKAYNLAPSPVKKLIANSVGIIPLLAIINHFTGWVEDAIYWACISVGMPPWAAWTVAKALTLFL